VPRNGCCAHAADRILRKRRSACIKLRASTRCPFRTGNLSPLDPSFFLRRSAAAFSPSRFPPPLSFLGVYVVQVSEATRESDRSETPSRIPRRPSCPRISCAVLVCHASLIISVERPQVGVTDVTLARSGPIKTIP